MTPVRRTSPQKGGTHAVRYVAWLRAINLPGRVVKMDRLRSVFESLGFSNVETFIASGNVIFESSGKTPARLERHIEAGLARAFGYPIDTFVRSTREVAAITEAPFARRAIDPGANLYVLFLRDEPAPAARRKVVALRNDLDDFDVHRREVYWIRRNVKARAGEPGPPLEKILESSATMRGMNTIRRLAARYCGMSVKTAAAVGSAAPAARARREAAARERAGVGPRER